LKERSSLFTKMRKYLIYKDRFFKEWKNWNRKEAKQGTIILVDECEPTRRRKQNVKKRRKLQRDLGCGGGDMFRGKACILWD